MIRTQIVNWLKDYISQSGMKGFVVGISGGIDSAVTSTLCAETGYPVLAVSLPIHQNEYLHSLSEKQIDWVQDHFSNIRSPNLPSPTKPTFILSSL